MSYPTAADPRPYPGYGLPLAFEPLPGLPGMSAPSASPPTASDPVEPDAPKQWQLTLDGERVIEPAALTLFGRNPQRGEDESEVAVVKVRDEARTVSKTHIAVGVDADGLFAVDRGSTNGSAVTNLDGDYKLLKAGERVPLAEGSTVAFGEHRIVVTLVERPTQAD